MAAVRQSGGALADACQFRPWNNRPTHQGTGCRRVQFCRSQLILLSLLRQPPCCRTVFTEDLRRLREISKLECCARSYAFLRESCKGHAACSVDESRQSVKRLIKTTHTNESLELIDAYWALAKENGISVLEEQASYSSNGYTLQQHQVVRVPCSHHECM